jgi:glycosyltransferase involved in cell wall biosynthesis
VPSAFLEGVFARRGIVADVVPNIVDLDRFRPRTAGAMRSPCMLVARSLEAIYDVATALRALALVREREPLACMIVAGSGPERARLEALAGELALGAAVRFTGAVDNARMPELYAEADIAVNPSTVDNMPISLLEAFASGVPVVSTDVGGVPFIARDGDTALLVPAGDPRAMADALLRLIADRALYARLRAAALDDVQRYGWPRVREAWIACYRRCAQPALQPA